MPDLTVNLGNLPITLPDTSDLVKFAEQQLPIAFTIADSDIVKFKDRHLADIPPDSGKPVSAGLKVPRMRSRKSAVASTFPLGLSANAQGSITLIRSGVMYRNGDLYRLRIRQELPLQS